MLLAEKVSVKQPPGQEFVASDQLVLLCEQFVSLLYSKPQINEISELWYQFSAPTLHSRLVYHLQKMPVSYTHLTLPTKRIV